MCPDPLFPRLKPLTPFPSVLVKPFPGRLPRGVGWTGSLTLRADVRLPHVRAYGDNRDRHAAEKGDPSLDPGPCCPSSLARSGSAAPPTSRDLADPVQLRLALHSHPLQGGQVEHRAAADVIIVVPAPVEIVVRELVTSEGERGLRHRLPTTPEQTNERPGISCDPPPRAPTWARHPHHPLLAIGPASTEPRAPSKGHAHSKRPRPHPVHPPRFLQAPLPQVHHSSASSARLRGLGGSGRSRTSAARGSRALIHFSTTQGWRQKAWGGSEL